MAVQRSLAGDPRYVDFVRRYAFDATRFAIEVIGITPTHQQIELFDSVSPFGSRTSVSSGHSTGKTAGFGIIGFWHLLCYFNSNTFLTAPKTATIYDGVWKEFADCRDRMLKGPHAWIVDYFTIESERVFVRGAKLQWFVACKTAPRGSPENLAGTHRDFLLWIGDEASGIPDENFGVIGGALTDARNRFVLASQPTRSSGFFRETHFSLSKEEGGPWNSMVFNSEESPLVSDQFIRDKLLEYGGRDSMEYQIKVLGMFPEDSEKYLLGRKIIENRIGAAPVVKAGWGWMLSVDVAAGEFRDKSVATLARVWGNEDYGEDARHVEIVDIPIYTNTRNLDDFTGQVFLLASSLSNCTVMIDSGGMGIAVCQRLETLGLPNVRRVKWGNPCFKTRYKERFFNLRAQASVLTAKAIKEGRLSILTEKNKKELLDQGSRIPYHFDEKARYVIEKKEDMRRDGIPSPDIWDTVCFLFLEDAYYTQSESDIVLSASDRKASARERALAELDGII